MEYKIKLLNTLTRKKEDFVPITPGEVGIYSCGPTVYNVAHIGNLRAFLCADTLRRTFEAAGYKINHVMNITDVGHLTDDADDGEDKMEKEAKAQGADAWELSRKYTELFFDHIKLLGIKKHHINCKATDHIQEQIDMVKTLEEKGYVYTTEDGVYFDTSKFEDYGKMAKLDIEGLQEGKRVDAGTKKSKTDFALWKFSPKDEKRQMEWDSPWGVGFPGWHIECSAMSMKYLGEQFDIHSGGVDHIPIHHTNEIAQSECATGKAPFANYWLHSEFLLTAGKSEKMSKSLGNITSLDVLMEKGYDPLAYRYFCLGSHYRKQLKYSLDNLSSAQHALERMRNASAEIKAQAESQDVAVSDEEKGYEEKMITAACNDLNTPQVIANLWGVLEDKKLHPAAKLRLIKAHDQLLGLSLLEAKERSQEIPEELTKLLEERQLARKEKRWGDADTLRDTILSKGYEILDTADGAKLKKKL